MPELNLEIGNRVFEVSCEAGEEQSLERAAKLLNAEAVQVSGAGSATTEKRMLLLAGLMLADTMAGVKDELSMLQENLRAAEERIRIAEAKSAMLAANAVKLETNSGSRLVDAEKEALRAENREAMELLGKVLADINTLAEAAEGVSTQS